jgi:hypothetical protein
MEKYTGWVEEDTGVRRKDQSKNPPEKPKSSKTIRRRLRTLGTLDFFKEGTAVFAGGRLFNKDTPTFGTGDFGTLGVRNYFGGDKFGATADTAALRQQPGLYGGNDISKHKRPGVTLPCLGQLIKLLFSAIEREFVFEFFN